MYYANYNDYELIYLISEGSEQALNLLYHKYYIYINKIVGKVNVPKYKREDLVQEGVNVLFASIKNFNPDKYNKTFFNYFKFALERKIYKLINTSTYYNSNLILTDNSFKDDTSSHSNLITIYRSLLKDELELEIFDNCLLDGLSLGAFAKKKGLTYKRVYYKMKCICERLKRYWLKY